MPLSHPMLDPAWRPHWIQVNTSTSSGSLLIQDSVDQALSELNPQSLREGQGRRIAGWLVLEPAQCNRALHHIARESIRPGHRGSRRLFRMHDPAVLWAAWGLLSPGQQAALMGPVSAWWLIDPSGAVIELQRGDDADARVWDSELWAALDRVGALNAMLRALLPADNPLRSGQLEDMRGLAMASMARAERLGFSDLKDLALFAQHAVERHPQFDAHPIVRQVLERREPDEHYSALIEQLTDDEWRLVSAGGA